MALPLNQLEGETPSFALLSSSVISPRCIACHSASLSSGGVDLSSRASTLASGSVIPGNPDASSLYTTTRDGSMPSIGARLSASEVSMIRAWIEGGALEDGSSGGVVVGTPGAAPEIFGVTPSIGPKTGGTRIIVNGSGFASGIVVKVGGANCGAVALASPTSLSCLTPAHAPAMVSVAVTNPDGLSDERLFSFTYEDSAPPPSVGATYQVIYRDILQPKCLSCHSDGGAFKGVNYSSYARTLSSGSVVAGNPGSSKMYLSVVDGSMPQGASNLSESQISLIQQWIQNGAPNN